MEHQDGAGVTESDGWTIPDGWVIPDDWYDTPPVKPVESWVAPSDPPETLSPFTVGDFPQEWPDPHARWVWPSEPPAHAGWVRRLRDRLRNWLHHHT